ncbi:V-type ATP synthase subunit I [Candidatus Riflebacteria bacterium]
MISKMGKYLFVGPETEKNTVIEKLQEVGVVQVAPFKAATGKEVESSRTALDRIADTCKFLKKFSTKSIKGATEEKAPDAGKLIQQIQNFKRELVILATDKGLIQDKISKLSIWGRFDLGLINKIEEKTANQIQFWETSRKEELVIIPRSAISKFWSTFPAKKLVVIPDNVVLLDLFSIEDKNYFLTISKESLELEGCDETRFETDIPTLEKDYLSKEKREKEIQEELCELAPYLSQLELEYQKALDSHNFLTTTLGSGEILEGRVFMLKGWCPEHNYPRLKKEMEELLVDVTDIAPEPGEKIPTFLKNNKWGDIGNDLVNIYDTPSYNDWDPSSWVFFTFAIFFAMILNDGGYGFTIFLLVLFLKFKFDNAGPGLTRFLNLSLVLSISSMIYGILSGGFFGAWIPDDTENFKWLYNLRLFFSAPTTSDQATNQGIIDNMMRVSIIIGLLHISLSLVLKSMRQVQDMGDTITPYANGAWIVGMWVFFFWYGKTTSHPLFFIFLLAMVVVFFTSAGTFESPVQVILGGLGGLYNAVQFFSDVLSYLRLFALGMSGALLAQTFNTLAWQLWHWEVPIPGLGIFLAITIFFVGHLITLGLGIMGGVIHGLRLNFLEWYRWSFDGDGRPFKPFKLLVEEK